MSATTETSGQPGPLGFARMAGSSVAGRDAAAWVTDFLNAAYYRRSPETREVADLRCAFGILTTYWYRSHPDRRLRITDLAAFHRAFGTERFAAGGLLSRDALHRGAAALLGDWFPEAYADPARRGWGIAFPTTAERDAYDPAFRMQLARMSELSPETVPLERQVWHTYDPIELPSAEGAIAALTRPETWPDYASELGRFTPLRPGGLAGQTFEIEVAANTRTALPVFTRGYVTITSLVTPEDPQARAAWFESTRAGLARHGFGPALPDGAEPLVGFDLTTHRGHFMGSGHNRLFIYAHEGRSWVRAGGTRDPMPWHLDKAYRAAGAAAQAAFWGDEDALSMLRQLALLTAP